MLLEYEQKLNYVAIELLLDLYGVEPTQNEIDSMESIIAGSFSRNWIMAYPLGAGLQVMWQQKSKIVFKEFYSAHLMESIRQAFINEVGWSCSARGIQCLTLWYVSKTWQQIAEILEISVRTVEDHIRRIKRQLCVGDKGELIAILRSWGLLSTLTHYSILLEKGFFQVEKK